MSEDLSNISLGTVLVTGGSGFIGSHCIKDVLRNGAHKVHTINPRMPPEDRKIPNVEYHAVDLGDAEEVKRVFALAQPDVVLHLSSPRPFMHSPATYQHANVQGTCNLLEACDSVSKATKALVYCSSGSVIHDGYQNLRYADESWPVLFAPQQKEPYWQTKAIAEKLILEHNRKNSQQMLTAALRVTSVFGAGDEQIVGPIMEQAKSGQLNMQIGEGKNLNDWTYVENVAEAHTHTARRLLRAVQEPDPQNRKVEGEAFFVTNDDPRPFFDFMRQVAREAGYHVDPDKVTKLPAFMANLIGFLAEWAVFITSFGQRKSAMSRKVMRYTVIDQYFRMEKAKQQLGYTPRISIEEGIKRSVAPLSQQREASNGAN